MTKETTTTQMEAWRLIDVELRAQGFWRATMEEFRGVRESVGKHTPRALAYLVIEDRVMRCPRITPETAQAKFEELDSIDHATHWTAYRRPWLREAIQEQSRQSLSDMVGFASLCVAET